MKHASLSRRAWATVLAACVHLLALAFMGWRIPRPPARFPGENDNPTMEVTLVRPPILPHVRTVAQAPRPGPTTPGASARVLVRPAPGAPALGALPSPPAPVPVEPMPDDRTLKTAQNLRNALRGLVGCADPAANHLSPEEQAACNQRLGAARPAPVGPQFSAQEMEQFNAGKTYDPLLVRRPHNGCLPRLADTPRPDHAPPRPMRSGAGTTAGAGCSVSF